MTGLWKEGFEKHTAKAEAVNENAETKAKKDKAEIDWEERHFRICLALLSRADIGIRGYTNDPSIPKIIRKADEMVTRLKAHYQGSAE